MGNDVFSIDGRNVSMWFDKWDSNGPLCDIIPRRECQFQPRHAFILWLATKERLATQDRIAKWNGQISTECPLCKKEKDSHEHLFFKCDYAEKIWYSLKVKMGRTHYNNELKSIKTSLSQTKANKNIGKVIARIALAAAVYFIWQERNWRIFKQEDRSVELKIITDNIRLRLMSLKVKQTSLNDFASNTLESSGHDCTFLVASFIQLGLGRKLDELVKEKRSSPRRCTIRKGLSLDIKGLGGWCINILYTVTGGLGGYN
ncbi:reverse transcriptase zinc-binding domain-containing protein [Tanacetum coccineum]